MKLFALILLMMLTAPPVKASHDRITDCHDANRALTYLRSANPNLAIKHHLAGAEALEAIKAYNIEPPATEYTGDEMAIYWDPTSPAAPWYVLILHQGCAFNGSPATPKMVDKLIGDPS